MTGVKRGSLQSLLSDKDGSLGAPPPEQEIHVPVPHGSELWLAAFSQMQVSSFPVESRKHLTSGWEQKLCCVSSGPPGTSLVNAWTWHLFTPTALDCYWHRKGPSLASGKTAGALERVKKQSRKRQDGMGQRTGQWMGRRKVSGSKPRGIAGRRRGGSPRAPGPSSPQQCLDHLPTWLCLIFAPCRQSSSCQLITLEQAENVAGLGLLFLLLALHEVCNQLLMSLPSHSLFLSPIIVIT